MSSLHGVSMYPPDHEVRGRGPFHLVYCNKSINIVLFLCDYVTHIAFYFLPYPLPSNVNFCIQFTQDELSAIKPQDIMKWMNMKLFAKEDPGDDEMPINGSHHTIDYYKKSISYFMPKKETPWDPIHQTGNPTRSNEVTNLVKRIRKMDEEFGTAKKRKSLDVSTNNNGEEATPSKLPPPLPIANSSNKKAKPSTLPAGFAGPIYTSAPTPITQPSGQGMGAILQRMHAQNAQFIELFGTLSQSLESAKAQLLANNIAILSEIAKVPPNQEPPPGGAIVLNPPSVPPHAAAAGGVTSSILDWQYVHPDGARRRVPPTWTFPSGNLQEMYLLWHCGDYQKGISPMKFFTSSDVSFLGKRARSNLNEVKNLMLPIDKEATLKGKPPSDTMTINQASECFQAGVTGCDFSATTPTGKHRNIMRLKWSTLTKYSSKPATKEEQEAAEALGEAKARDEFVVETGSSLPNDNWWYEHDDGIKRRVPSTYSFPMLGLSEMYVLWHCGDQENKISPMKLFHASDVSPFKRAKTNLSEVRAVMTIIDLNATKHGLTIKSIMTPDEAKECVRVGYTGLNISPKTPDGRERDILTMKWSSAVRLKGGKEKKSPAKSPKSPELGEPLAEATVDL